MWPLECQQGFTLFWPGDLVSDSKWPGFELDLEIIKTNILSNIHDDYSKHVTSGVLTRFSFNLAWWRSSLPQMTQFQTWPRNHQDKHFEQDPWWLLKNVTSWVLKTSSFDLALWPRFWPTVPSFESHLEIIKTNILSKIHDDRFKNVTARMLARFSVDLVRWPSFLPQVTQFWAWPRNHQDKHFEFRIWPRTHEDKHFEQDSWWLL